MDRATRRYLTKKKHKKREKLYKELYAPYMGPGWQRVEDAVNRQKGCRIARETFTRCSCYMCGNPRRHFNEKTWQEKLVDEELKDWNE